METINYKEKAEQYVREHCEELMELSLGCQLRKFERVMIFISLLSHDNASHTLTFKAPNGTIHNGTYTTAEIEELVIIGHPIQLQHWLAMLYKVTQFVPELRYLGHTSILFECSNTPNNVKTIYFNLTTGQPATEADYQKFNEIVGI